MYVNSTTLLKMSEEVRVAVLEQKLEDLKEIIVKIDDAIEKLSEVNSNVSKILAVHEERITKQEETDSLLLAQIDKFRDKANSDYDNLLFRVQGLEKKLWVAVGVLFCLGFIVNNSNMVVDVLTPDSPRIILDREGK